MKRLILFTFLLLSIITCTKSQVPFIRPESVVWDAPRNRYLVSCVESKNIVAVDPNGNVISELKSGLLGPKGMVLIDTVLYFTDVTRVMGINVNTAVTTLTQDVQGAQFLNDIAYDGGRYLYVSDSQTNNIRKIDIVDNGETSFVTTFNSGPNGIWYDSPNNRLVVVYMAETPQKIQSINITDKSIGDLSNMTFTRGDGLAFNNNTWYVSSWTTGKIYSLNQDMTAIIDSTAQTFDGPADFMYNAQTNQFVVPVMMEHRLAFLDKISNVNDSKTVGLRIGPNPASEKLSFQAEKEYEGGRYTIVDMDGRILLKGQLKDGAQEIAVKSLAPGSYFLKIEKGKLSATEKFIKK